ncbi:MAG: ABC transporter ATP-binding protein [Deltaproteobacteria bacterium]|nr:ABC transporter ATP-binding protein [Deltaproteobacteria bacterium]
MASVTINKAWKRYGKIEAVKNLSLECKDKEFLCLLGPSGCGKSSTLRMVAGLEQISEGTISIGDRVVNELEPKDRDVAMVFESYALYPHKTVFENMAYPLRLRSHQYSSAQIKERVKHAAEILEISDLLDRMPRQLSGGQRQRVAIGRAIVRDPQVFLMDEPISHLDAKLRTHMRGELKHLHKELNATMLYVTHDQLEAMSMADRIAIMNLGVLQQVGTPDEIFNHPVNEFVAGFVGDPPMNFINCRLEVMGDQWYLGNSAFKIGLSPEMRKSLEKNGHAFDRSLDVRLGVRPENFTISAKKSTEDSFQVEVYVTEPLGEDMIVDVLLQENKLKLKTRIEFEPKMGDKIWLDINKRKMHLFDHETTKAYF